MKLVKMFCLTAVAAVAAMAFIGASSASATALCLNNEEPCAAGNVKLFLLALSAKSAANGFLGGLFTQECHVEIHGHILSNTTHEPATIHTAWLLGSCSPCSTVTVTAVGTVTATGGGNGVIKGSGKALFKGCPLGAECEFEGAGVELTALGSATNATVDANVKLKLVKGSAFLCGSEGTYHATFTGVGSEDKMAFVTLL